VEGGGRVGKLFSFFYHLVMSFRKLFLPALIGNVESELKPVDEEGPVPNRSTGARWLNEVEVIGTKQAIEPRDLILRRSNKEYVVRCSA